MPRAWWADAPAIVVGLALGVALGVATAALAQPTPRGSVARGWAAEARMIPAAELPEAALAAARVLRDEAEALTPAAVALDEAEYERWLERSLEVEAALADPTTPGPIRVELAGARAALVRVGVIRPVDGADPRPGVE